jgi:hypothetical protein
MIKQFNKKLDKIDKKSLKEEKQRTCLKMPVVYPNS